MPLQLGDVDEVKPGQWSGADPAQRASTIWRTRARLRLANGRGTRAVLHLACD